MAPEAVDDKKSEDPAPSELVKEAVADVKDDLEVGDAKEEDTDMAEKVEEDEIKGGMEIDEEIEDQAEKGDLEESEEKIEVKGEEIVTKKRKSVKKSSKKDQVEKDGDAEATEIEKEASDQEDEGDMEKDEEKEDEEEEEEKEEEVIKKVRNRRKASDKEPVTPVTPSERPTRERKLVERYSVPTPSRSPASKVFIEKGSGTQLKDIPNVAFMLSKRKPDEILQLLHSVLYGKKAKVHSLKKNIGQFSGYVWAENEEKQRARIKERLDKCVKEKLTEFCYVLNIPINKAVTKKEELCTKLFEFLESPQSTTEILLADKEQKGKKRKSVTPSKIGSAVASTESTKKQKTSLEYYPKLEEPDDKSGSSDAKEDSDKENGEDVKKESEAEQSEEDEPKEQKKSKKSSSKKTDKEKSRSKSKSSPVEKESPASKSVKKISSSTPKDATPKDATPSFSSKSKAKSQKVEKEPTSKDVTPGSSSKLKGSASKKQKVEKESEDKSAPSKIKATRTKETSKSPAKKRASASDSGKGKKVKKAKAEPSRGEMHAIVVDILKEVDFNTATLSDIIRQLGTHFGMDLMHRKAEVKEIIADVINSMSDVEDEDEEEAEEKAESGEKDEKKDGSDNEKSDEENDS